MTACFLPLFSLSALIGLVTFAFPSLSLSLSDLAAPSLYTDIITHTSIIRLIRYSSIYLFALSFLFMCLASPTRDITYQNAGILCLSGLHMIRTVGHATAWLTGDGDVISLVHTVIGLLMIGLLLREILLGGARYAEPGMTRGSMRGR